MVPGLSDTIDLEALHLAQYMHKAWKKRQNTVYWVDINLALKGLKFYQTRSNAIILHETLPAYCIPKVVRMETGEVLHEKVYMSPRPPPKISLKHDWTKENWVRKLIDNQKGKLFDNQEEKLLNKQNFSNQFQPIPNPIRDRSGQPVSRKT